MPFRLKPALGIIMLNVDSWRGRLGCTWCTRRTRPAKQWCVWYVSRTRRRCSRLPWCWFSVTKGRLLLSISLLFARLGCRKAPKYCGEVGFLARNTNKIVVRPRTNAASAPPVWWINTSKVVLNATNWRINVINIPKRTLRYALLPISPLRLNAQPSFHWLSVSWERMEYENKTRHRQDRMEKLQNWLKTHLVYFSSRSPCFLRCLVSFKLYPRLCSSNVRNDDGYSL